MPNKKRHPDNSATIIRFLNNVLLLFVACVCVVIIVAINKPWFERVSNYWHDFEEQKTELDLEQRKAVRYGNAYIVSKTISDHLEKIKEKEKALVLIPPTEYFRTNNIDYHVPEPAVFYYYTSLRTVWADTKDTTAINWVVYVENGRLTIGKINNQGERDAFLQQFRKYKTSL